MLTPVFELWVAEWCDRRGRAAGLYEAVDQHVGGGPLTRIHADEDRDGLAHRPN